MDYISTGYPNPPLGELFMICKEIINWLDSDSKNVAIVHCQKSKSRSALIFSCVLFDMGVYPHPCAALTDVCNNRNSAQAIPVFLTPVTVFMQDTTHFCAAKQVQATHCNHGFLTPQLNEKKPKIKKIIMSEVPEIDLLPEHKKDPTFSSQKKIKPYLQIFHDKRIVYNTIDREEHFPNIEEGEPIIFHVDLEIDGDVLVRLRHFMSAKIRYPVIRIMLNSSMLVTQTTRYYLSDMDVGDRVKMSKDFYVDVYVEMSDIDSENYSLLAKIREREQMMRGVPQKNLVQELPQSKDESDSAFEIGDESQSSSGQNTPLENSKGGSSFNFDPTFAGGSLEKKFEKSKIASVIERPEKSKTLQKQHSVTGSEKIAPNKVEEEAASVSYQNQTKLDEKAHSHNEKIKVDKGDFEGKEQIYEMDKSDGFVVDNDSEQPEEEPEVDVESPDIGNTPQIADENEHAENSNHSEDGDDDQGDEEEDLEDYLKKLENEA